MMTPSRRNMLEVNSEIKDILRGNNINLVEGISVLVLLYYGLQPTFIPDELQKKIFSCNIVTMDFVSKTLVWKRPLFEETETEFGWIKDWMNLFRDVNPSRRGVRKDVLTRMKRFFVNNPGMTKEKVFQATGNYLRTVKDSQYCKMSHKFIYEDGGSSMLQEYVDNIEEQMNKDRYFNSDII